MSTKLKVYELAKELNIEPQHLVDLAQRLGVDVKNTMSILGTEEVRNIRDYYRKNKTFTKSATPVVPVKPNVTEKRVGTTLIRRRAAKVVEEVVAEPVPEVIEVETVEILDETLLVAEEVATTPLEVEEIIVPIEVVAEVATPAPIVEPPKEEKPVVSAKLIVEMAAPKPEDFFLQLLKR